MKDILRLVLLPWHILMLVGDALMCPIFGDALIKHDVSRIRWVFK